MRKFYFLLLIICIFPQLIMAEGRNVGLDMFLIIDDSAALREARSSVLAWVNDHVIDRILMEGDNITVWAARDRAEIIYSGTISGQKEPVKSGISNLGASGSRADFTEALRDASGRASQVSRTSAERLAYTMLITASATGLEPVLTSAPGLIRWSRSLRYEGWQVLIINPGIEPRVREAAQAYMNSRR